MYEIFSIILLHLIAIDYSVGDINLNIKEKIIENPGQYGECGQQYLNLNLNTYIKMLDASSKLEIDGILQGNFYDLGFYDECLSIKSEKDDFFGKYCLATLSISNIIDISKKIFPKQQNFSSGIVLETKKMLAEKTKLGMISQAPSLLGYHFGLCVPHRCSASNLSSAIPILTFDDEFCYTKGIENNINTNVIFALSIIGTLVALVLMSTLYDIFQSFGGGHRIGFMFAFSAYTNGKELFKSNKNQDQLLCIHGLKSLSMIWVVLGHTLAHFGLSVAMNNWKYMFSWLDDTWNMVFISATLAVDSFFAIGGILTVYTFMKSPILNFSDSFGKIPMLYLHRYMRLTPAFSVVVLAYSTGLIKYLSEGPRWGTIDALAIESCRKYWWTSLLYIQNYFDGTVCVDQSWYLAVDMQLFLLTPFLLIPLRRWPKFTLVALAAFTILGMVIPFWIGYQKKLSGLAFGSITDSFTRDYYFKTYTRFGPYVIGMLAGYYIFKMKYDGKTVTWNKFAVFSAWIITVSILSICVFDGHKLVKNTNNALEDGFYLGFNRSAWAAAICFLIILCVSGNGGIINTFLELPIFQVISKLSYSIYLIHLAIIMIVNLSSRDTIHFSNFIVIYQFFGHFSLTLILSMLFYLIVDAPSAVIMKLIFPRNRKRNL